MYVVIDHHRINDFATSQPVSFRNEIVGSTATIIATMYRENQIPIPKEMAPIPYRMEKTKWEDFFS